MSGFPPARPPKDGRNGGGKRKRTPKPRPRCAFVASGYANHNDIPICGQCGGLRSEPQHDWPETPPEATEVDERRTR